MIEAKKSLGQNFLKDELVLERIANSINTLKDDLIIEIGPGTGALTKHLVKKNSYLLCYEIDTRMRPILSSYESDKTKIIYNDILKADLTNDIKDINYNNIYVIANIPYYITTPIIKYLTKYNIKSMSLLIQKEVADRFCAKPHTKEYGSISVYLNYYFNIEYLFTVKNTCFTPIPKVDSALINLTKKEIKSPVIDEELFFNIVNKAFTAKRKTLKNNLKDYNWNIVKEVLLKNNLNESVRAEELSLNIFIEIANNLKTHQ